MRTAIDRTTRGGEPRPRVPRRGYHESGRTGEGTHSNSPTVRPRDRRRDCRNRHRLPSGTTTGDREDHDRGPWSAHGLHIGAIRRELPQLVAPSGDDRVHRPLDLAGGTWVKLGWAYATEPAEPLREPALDEWFPEVVVRGAARLNPGLKIYRERLPRTMSHYGGYYTMTKENWPLIGPAGPDGSFVVGALSGFGTMAACAAGHLAAALAAGADVPDHAHRLGLARYEDPGFVAGLETMARRSIL